MPVYFFDSSGNPVQQRPIYIFQENNPILIKSIYEFDSTATPRLVYNTGPDWLARHISGSNAEFNSPYITGLSNVEIGSVDLYSTSKPHKTIWGINLQSFIADSEFDQGSGGNNGSKTIEFSSLPGILDLTGASAISITAEAYLRCAVHGVLNASAYFYVRYKQPSGEYDYGELIGNGTLNISGDPTDYISIPIKNTINIDSSSPQTLSFFVRVDQQSAQSLSNSLAVLSIKAIDVIY